MELVPEWQMTPDDEEVYERIEDSLVQTEDRHAPTRTSYRLLWRLRADSLIQRFDNLASFIRINLLRPNQQANIILEKDAGERNIADFWGGGFSLSQRGWRWTFGDFLCHFGRGLLFSAPDARSGFTLTDTSTMLLARAALENRNLRGLRIDRTSSRFALSLLGSYSLRDARLNADGTIARLKFSGFHGDSSALKEKAVAGQLLTGLTARMTVQQHLAVGMAIQGVRFNRRFAGTASTASFFGQNLAGVSIFLVAGTKGKRGEIEVTRSLPGSFALGAQVVVNEGGVRSKISGAVYQAGFYAPAGRVYALTNRLFRAELTLQAGYERAGFSIQFEGRTLRDYKNDSIPGRLQFRAGYETPPLKVKLISGTRFYSEREVRRNSTIELDANWRIINTKIILGDEYPFSAPARGRMAVLYISVRTRQIDISVTGAVVDIKGSGVTINVPESGVMRVGASFSIGETAQRLSLALALRIKRLGRLGVRFALTHRQDWNPDFGFQMELMN